MTIHVVIEGETATASGPFPFSAIKLFAALPGRKRWIGQSAVSFDATPFNIERLKKAGTFKFEDRSGVLENIEELANMATQHSAPKLVTKYKPLLALRDYQKKALSLAKGREAYAYLMEMGLGKTAVAIADMAILHLERNVKGALIIAPKGVDRQWIENEIPKHLNAKQVPYDVVPWKGKPIHQFRLREGRMTFFAMNIDAINTDKGFEAATAFLRATGLDSAIILDESHKIKNFEAQRTKAAYQLGEMAKYKRILTGTPISRSLEDMFAQFYFLNPRILGHKYRVSFRGQYCVMGGYENRQVVGQKNVEQFYTLIAPHSYRLTKAEALDLPPKVYIVREYDLDAKTRKAYDDLKKSMMTKLNDGTIASVSQATTLVLRLQELICGRLMREDGTYESFGDGRLNELFDIIEQISGPVTIWCRFKGDIEKVTAAINATDLGRAVHYYGGTSNADREINKKEFLEGRARFFVSTTGAGGTGLNLQGDCSNVIYYSQDFNATNRWQSEDRTHRSGMKGDKMTYFIITARKTVDRLLSQNLSGKAAVASLTLDQIRKLINE